VSCQVFYNHRIKDVMVLSELSYLIKFQIPNNNNRSGGSNSGNQDDDRVTINFKKLTSNEDEEPIGI
jgi:hypothetical protein